MSINNLAGVRLVTDESDYGGPQASGVVGISRQPATIRF